MKIRTIKGSLSLSQNPGLNIFLLGAGSAFSKKMFQTNFLILKEDDHLLIDCGTTGARALNSAGLSVLDIGNIFITHSHSDHVGGLEQLMLMQRYVSGTKPNLYGCQKYLRQLWGYSLKGGMGFNEKKNNGLLSLEDYVNISPIKKCALLPRDTYEFNVGSLNVIAARNCHIPDKIKSWRECAWSTSIIIDKRIFLTADTRFEPVLLNEVLSAFDIEYIYHDCQFYPEGVHAFIEEINTLPKDVKKKIILTHYGDNFNDFKDKVRDYGFHSLAKQQRVYSF